MPAHPSAATPTIFVAFPGWLEIAQTKCANCTVIARRRLRRLRRMPRLQRMRLLHRLPSPRPGIAPHRADAVVFHVPTTPLPIPMRKAPGQTWVAWSMESEVTYPQLADPGFMEQFELTVSYRRDADVVVAYCDPADWLGFEPPSAPERREPAAAVYIASSDVDHSGRTEYVRELMRHMPVDSYGRSLNNRSLGVDHGRRTKLETISRYRFTLAFENSVARDYVTEKFYDPLLVGSVPVYLGAPDVADYAPGAGSYIDVRDFAGPAELAAHLVEVSQDEDRYRRHHAWHGQPPAARFRALVEEQRVPAMCRLCRLLRERAVRP